MPGVNLEFHQCRSMMGGHRDPLEVSEAGVGIWESAFPTTSQDHSENWYRPF